MIKRMTVSIVAVVSVLGAGASCNSSSGGAAAPLSGQMQIYSWWVSGGEQQALTALLKDYTDQYPGVQVANETGSDAVEAQQQLQQRLAADQKDTDREKQDGIQRPVPAHADQCARAVL